MKEAVAISRETGTSFVGPWVLSSVALASVEPNVRLKSLEEAMRRIFATLFLLALGGCAGMNLAERHTADWRAIGCEDGAKGQSPDYFGERRKACAERGITADFSTNLTGRAQGLEQFCRSQNGYRLGVRGRRYSGVCPDGLEAAFLAAHADGYGLYERQAALRSISKRLHNGKERAKELEYLLAETTALLISSEVDATERAAIAIDLKQLAEEKAEVEVSISQLEYDYVRKAASMKRRRDKP